MKHTRFTTLPFLTTLALALCASSTVADDASAADARNELVVFGGISLLDASRSSQTTIDVGNIDLPGMPGFGGRFGGRFERPPISIPPLSVESETSIGSSALFGARYSRLIKDRLAVEADLTIAPSHELESRASGCVADFCVGSSNGRRAGDGRFQASLGDRNVAAWHYGAGLAYELTGGDVRPLLLLGGGGVSWDGARAAGTDFVFRFGAGLKILFGRAGARVDVVDHLVLDHFASGKTEHDVHATAGLLVRF
jgi:hypothetical protein